MIKMASVTKRIRNTHKPWVCRYRDESGRSREAAFATKREAEAYRAEVEHGQRYGTWQDPKLASVGFTEYAGEVVGRMAVSDGTRSLYRGIVRNWLGPWAGSRTLAQVSQDREGATNLLNRDMRSDTGLLSYTRRGIAHAVLLATVNEGVAAGKLTTHRLNGIRMIRDNRITDRSDFVFPSHEQVSELAASLNGYGLAVWLMRGCGLRIRESLAVHREDFRDRGRVLRVSRQASLDGTHAVPLKHRRPGQFRDVPVPAYVWDMVKLTNPRGPVCQSGNGTLYPSYSSVYKLFTREAKRLGIPAGFHPHSLRHAYATALLTNGAQLHEVSQWLGHQSTEVTSKIYAHVLPSSVGRARSILDAEYDGWQHPMATAA